MIVFVNDKEISLFRGSRAGNAALRYCTQMGKKKEIEDLLISDAWGHTIASDSPLSEGCKIYVKEKE